MAGYNTSSAYDLSVFEQPVKEAQAPKLKVVKNRRQIAAVALSPRVLSAFAIIVMLISLIVYNRVQLTELTSQLDVLSTEMETLQSENAKMTSALDSAISLRKIAELAEEMGMQRRDEYQTERIYLYQEDKIERTEQTPSAAVGDNAKIAIASLFSRFKEYMITR